MMKLVCTALLFSIGVLAQNDSSTTSLARSKAQFVANVVDFGMNVQMAGFASAVVNGEAVMRDTKRSVNFTGSDPRTDGATIPQQPPVPALNAQP